MINKCILCNTQFNKHPKAPHRKFCSVQCQQKYWKLQNKEYIKQSRKKYIKDIPPKCRVCNKDIPKQERNHGVKFCSDMCRTKQCNLNTIKSRKKKHKIFTDFKIKKGCIICNYNKFGGSLDFHHINPLEKKFRISAKHFCSQSKLFKSEFKKCILVCKNCHYELHELLRNNIELYNLTIRRLQNEESI